MAKGRTPPGQNEIAINDLLNHFGDIRTVNGLNLDIKKDLHWIGT